VFANNGNLHSQDRGAIFILDDPHYLAAMVRYPPGKLILVPFDLNAAEDKMNRCAALATTPASH